MKTFGPVSGVGLKLGHHQSNWCQSVGPTDVAIYKLNRRQNRSTQNMKHGG